MSTIRMTVGQALVRFLDNQYIAFDGTETKFVEGVFTVFGHGIVCGLGQALDEAPGSLKVFQGKNEQGMAHAAASFAKQHNRRKIIACASSIGPGAANMVTAAAMATVNNIPLLLLPGDAFSTRQPDPVLQQVEQPYNLGITTNDAFKPVVKYWDRVSRPEQLMTAMISALRVLTDPAECGAVCVALPQDVQGESYDFPDYFFQKRVHIIPRRPAEENELGRAVRLVMESKKPLLVCGGGARYSEAGKAIQSFCESFHIPMAETQAGKSAVPASFPLNLGGVGVTGNLAANTIAEQCDVVIGVGTRFSDFTTGSKEIFRNPDVKFISLNTSVFHATKLDGLRVVGDAKACLTALTAELREKGYRSGYGDEIACARTAWAGEMERLASLRYSKDYEPLVKARDPRSIKEFVELTGGVITQTAALAMIRRLIPADAIAVGASGSLPGDMQRMWETDELNSYNMEYGYSTMGYEIAGALGSKLACPDREVYAMTGDGSYLMLHSELVTSIQEGMKINVLLFDNAGFGCINNLQMSNGIGSLATEFRRRDSASGRLDGPLMHIDFAASASGYGVKTYTARTMEELEAALLDSMKQERSTLIDIKVLPKSMTDGYLSWWHVGIASMSSSQAVTEAHRQKEEGRSRARQY